MTETNISTARVPQVTVIDPRIPEKAKLRVAAYARVSSDSEDQVNSYIAQVRGCAEIICHADGIHFAREFCADHESQSGIHSISRSRTAPSPKYTSTFHGRYRLL